MKKTVAMFLLFMASNTFAASYEHDWRSGNSYSTTDNADGGATIRGRNRSGDTWTTTIENDGDQRGRDANGNYWTYDSKNGRYFNFGTGESCYGNGVARRCY